MSGLIAETLVLVFSRVGGGVILILGQCLMFLGAFHLSVVDIVDAFREPPPSCVRIRRGRGDA